MYRTHTCGQLRKEDAGKNVRLCGWVAKRRNLGSIVFIDLRDRYGITQIAFDEEHAEDVKDVRNEYVAAKCADGYAGKECRLYTGMNMSSK